MDPRKGIILVGVGGGQADDAALRFAIDEARRTGDSVEMVTAWTDDPISLTPRLPPDGVRSASELQWEAGWRQERSGQRVFGDVPPVTVARRVVHGKPGPALTEAAASARMLVLGSRGFGPVRAVLMGSISRYCAYHAPCPVVVVPGAKEPATEVPEDLADPARSDS